jgi:polar amino acid transport system substrate-binding protein
LTEDYPPYNFIDKNMNITGQSTEMVRAALQVIGQDASIELMLLSDALKLAEQPDTAIYSINRTAAREQKFKWAGPLGSYEQAFYAKKGTTITLNKLEDAKSAGLIGVYKDDAGNQFLTAQGFTNLNESLTDVEALKKLINNEVQLWLGNKSGVEATAAEAKVNMDDIVLVPGVTIQADLYIAFSKDTPDERVSAWQKALDRLKQEKDSDGKTFYDKLRAKYSDPYYVQSLMH